MFSLPNLISISRMPLALCFLQENPFYRSVALVIALITDGLDGYIARKFNQSSRLGTLLDPFTDKFFVILAASVLISEDRLTLFELCMLISRDFSVFIFGFYLWVKGELGKYRFQSIWCGKVTTVLQFVLVFAVVWDIPIPSYAFGTFVLLGVLALFELYFTPRKQLIENS